MANFQQHLAYGLGVSALCSGIGYSEFNLSAHQAGAAFVLGSLASLAPDLDHPEGVPGKILADILIALVPIGFLLYLPLQYKERLALEHWILLFFISYLIVKPFYFYIMPKLTTHRGIFHSLPAAIICGELVFLLFFHLGWSHRLIIGAIGMIGYLTHLTLDEVYSIEWNKMAAKSSLGSAMDLGSLRKFSTWLAYALLLGLGWVIWYEYDPTSATSCFSSLLR